MTLAQKKARENFKKAIAYRQKTGVSLKEAFAHVKGKKVGAVKKKVKKAAKKKTSNKILSKPKTIKVSKQKNNTTSKKVDKKLKALAPGKRISKYGTTYYENRSNRSDKGILLGVDTNRYAMGNVNMSKLITEISKENKLKSDVIKILKSKVKDYDNNYKSLLKDILYNGLQSGIISDLIYYSDTTKWYKKHRAEIKKMLYELMSDLGTNNLSDIFGNKWDSEDPFAEDTSNQNLLAWFSFEETAREIADRLGYEI
jgi:hypothetical protein